MQTIIPHLWFDDEAEEALNRYVDVFDDSNVGTPSRYDEATAAISGRTVGATMTVPFELEGREFLALNGGPQFTFTPAISFVVTCPTRGDVDELWRELSDGGTVRMPLDSYAFSERYGWTDDEYGVSWQLRFDDDVSERTIVPSLLFVGDQCGRAEEAIDLYTSVFDDSATGTVVRYGPGREPDEEGTIASAEFTLCGQRFAATDSAHEHAFSFNEAVSLVIRCETQDEIDHYWESLSAVPAAERCGWLKDRFGVSWQVVPTALDEMLRDGDAERTNRVSEAVLGMEKLDVATLRRAYERRGADSSERIEPPSEGKTAGASTEVATTVDAPRGEVYGAFLDPDVVAAWLPPEGMTGKVHQFDPREGGEFRVSLTYDDVADSPDGAGGKSTANSDTHHGRFVRLVPDETIVQSVEFESDDPAFAGEMRITVTLEDAGAGTEITYRCDDIPRGIRPEDNEAGCRSSLRKLASLLE